MGKRLTTIHEHASTALGQPISAVERGTFKRSFDDIVQSDPRRVLVAKTTDQDSAISLDAFSPNRPFVNEPDELVALKIGQAIDSSLVLLPLQV